MEGCLCGACNLHELTPATPPRLHFQGARAGCSRGPRRVPWLASCQLIERHNREKEEEKREAALRQQVHPVVHPLDTLPSYAVALQWEADLHLDPSWAAAVKASNAALAAAPGLAPAPVTSPVPTKTRVLPRLQLPPSVPAVDPSSATDQVGGGCGRLAVHTWVADAAAATQTSWSWALADQPCWAGG